VRQLCRRSVDDSKGGGRPKKVYNLGWLVTPRPGVTAGLEGKKFGEAVSFGHSAVNTVGSDSCRIESLIAR
jgi:hypothetical protein